MDPHCKPGSHSFIQPVFTSFTMCVAIHDKLWENRIKQNKTDHFLPSWSFHTRGNEPQKMAIIIPIKYMGDRDSELLCNSPTTPHTHRLEPAPVIQVSICLTLKFFFFFPFLHSKLSLQDPRWSTQLPTMPSEQRAKGHKHIFPPLCSNTPHGAGGVLQAASWNTVNSSAVNESY